MSLQQARPYWSWAGAEAEIASPKRLFSGRYRAEARSARAARAAVAVFAASCGFGDEELDDVENAVGEATANAIEHGNRGTGWFTLTCGFRRDTLIVEVKDRGAGFTRPAAAPGLDERSKAYRGWGISLMHALMDRVTFEDGGSRVRLEKRLAPRQQPAAGALSPDRLAGAS